MFFTQILAKYTAGVSCRLCSPVPYRFGGVKIGLGLTGKLGGAWVSAWVVHGVVLIYVNMHVLFLIINDIVFSVNVCGELDNPVLQFWNLIYTGLAVHFKGIVKFGLLFYNPTPLHPKRKWCRVHWSIRFGRNFLFFFLLFFFFFLQIFGFFLPFWVYAFTIVYEGLLADINLHLVLYLANFL